MSNQTDSNMLDGAQDLGARGARVFSEVGHWLTNNSADIALSMLAALVIALILLGLRRFGHHLVRNRGEDARWRTIFGRVLSKTSLFFIVMCAIQLVLSQTGSPRAIGRTAEILFIIAAALQAAVWGRELILGFIYHRVGEAEEQSTLGSAIGIIRLLVTVALFAIAVILILDNLGVNVTGLVAGLGIGGIAIGLAAQGIFSDLFAALSIIFDRPFRRGDTITFGSPPTTGTVERIGLKSTRVRALSGEEVVMANTKLLEQKLQNFAPLTRRRAVMLFGVVYQTPADLLARIGPELQAICEAQEHATFDRAHAFQFGASSIDFEFVFHVESADYNVFMEARQGIMLAMIRRFEELGIDFAYPTQVTYTAAPDGTLVMPYAHVRMLAEADTEAMTK